MESIKNLNLPDHSVSLLRYLRDVGSAGQKELIDQLHLPLRKIRYAIRRLKEEQLIISRPDLLDMRSLKYEVNPQMKDQIDMMLHTGETTA